MSNLSPQMTRNVFHYRTGTLFNQKHAVRFKKSTSLQYPFFNNQTLHFLLGCQHNIISGMTTERHNVACRLIMKAISKGSLAGCKAHMDAGSTTALPKKTFKFPSTLVIGLYPFGFLMLVCLSETGLLPVALMLFWLLPYLLNLRHLPLPNCNKCSMLIS